MMDLACSGNTSSAIDSERFRARVVDEMRGLAYLYKELGEAGEAKAMADRMRDFLVGDLIEREREAKRKEIADVTGPASSSQKPQAL